MDMDDLKPDAPKEFRGEFKPIATNVPGVQICELFPLQAKMWDKMAVIRSIVSIDEHSTITAFGEGQGEVRAHQRLALGLSGARYRQHQSLIVRCGVTHVQPHRAKRLDELRLVIRVCLTPRPYVRHSADDGQSQAVRHLLHVAKSLVEMIEQECQCGCSSNPASASAAISLRIVAELIPPTSPVCKRAIVFDPMGSPVSI